jgi:hypothetical protein
MVAQVGYSVVGRSRGRVTPCAVCTMHMDTKSASFLVEPQNQRWRFVSGLTSKPLGQFSLIWPQNRWWRFLGWASKPSWWRVPQFGPQNRQLRFKDLGLKISATVSWFGRQNQAGFSLSVAPQNRWEDVTAWDTRWDLAAYFMWKQVWLGFPNLASTLAEARRRVMHVAPSQRLRRSQVEDRCVDVTGCVGPCYPYFIAFILLDTRGIVVI